MQTFLSGGVNTHPYMPATPTMTVQTPCSFSAGEHLYTHTLLWLIEKMFNEWRETAGMEKGVRWWTFTSHPWPRVRNQSKERLLAAAELLTHARAHTRCLYADQYHRHFGGGGGASHTCLIPTAPILMLHFSVQHILAQLKPCFFDEAQFCHVSDQSSHSRSAVLKDMKAEIRHFHALT